MFTSKNESKKGDLPVFVRGHYNVLGVFVSKNTDLL